jgi:hypothetical protein
LILTSNRVGEIDEAFRSRIHICLFYPKLDKISVTQVWERNLNRVKTSNMNIDLEEDEIRHFYEILWLENDKHPSRHWNGRQIKNAFQTAIALAHWDFNELPPSSRPERPILRARHFKRVGRTSAHFDDYIGSVYGIEEQDAYSVLAAREEIRRDTGPALTFMLPKEPRTLSTRTARLSRQSTLQKRDSDESSEIGDDDPVSWRNGEHESADSDMDRSDQDEALEKVKYERELAKLKKKYSKR